MPRVERCFTLLAGLVCGAVGIVAGTGLYARLFGETAPGVLLVPTLALVGLTVAIGWRRGLRRWFAAGLVPGAGLLFLAGLVFLTSLVPDVTDDAQRAITKPRLERLERSDAFVGAPPGLRLTTSAHSFDCADWFDAAEPSVRRTYRLGAVTPAVAAAWFAQRWAAAGYRRVPYGSDRDQVWERTEPGWTASLTLSIYGRNVQVIGRDATSRVCQAGD